MAKAGFKYAKDLVRGDKIGSTTVTFSPKPSRDPGFVVWFARDKDGKLHTYAAATDALVGLGSELPSQVETKEDDLKVWDRVVYFKGKHKNNT